MKKLLLLGLSLIIIGQLAAQTDLLERMTRINPAALDQDEADSLSRLGMDDSNATWIHYYHKGNSSLKIYPNPAVDWINVQFIVEHGQGIQLELFDITGRSISNLISHYIPEGEFVHSVNISDLDLNPGIYLIRLQVHSAYFTKKIIIN